MEISKVKLVSSKKVDGGKTLSVEYFTKSKSGLKGYHADEYESMVHGDLQSAFGGLTVHFGLLTETVDAEQILNVLDYPLYLTEHLRVTSYSRGGSDEKPGFTITGIKTLKSGKTVLMTTPFTLLSENEETAYPHLEAVQGAFRLLESEVEQYLKGKSAPDPQQSLPFGDEPITHAIVADPETHEEKAERVLGAKPKGKRGPKSKRAA